MQEKTLNIGDKVRISTRDREWEGYILESYSSEVILLKLSSGYNIGLREEDILKVKVLEEAEKKEKTRLKKRQGVTGAILPSIAVIITGGTISARLDPRTGGVISTDAEELLNIAPGIDKICNIARIEKPFMKFSENMASKDWKKLAETCKELLDDEKISGIIITHGTDTLHYTSAALSFFLRDLNKPIALTYSQRSIDRGSTDAALNLICSAKYAVSDIAEVAIIGHKDLNDYACLALPGTKVRKMHTSRRDTFKAINSEPIAEISLDSFKILREFNARHKGKVKLDDKFESKIALVQVYPGQSPDILEWYVSQGYKGIILEVLGIGQVPGKASEENWLPKIKKLIDKGIVICATPQTIYGRVDSKVYENGRELEKTGVLFLEDMLSETAFVKLGWVLGHKDWAGKEKIKEKMLENISGEFNKRLEA